MELEHIATSASPFCIMDIYRGVFGGTEIRVIDEAVSGQIFVYSDEKRIATLKGQHRFYLGVDLGTYVFEKLTRIYGGHGDSV